VRSSGFGYHRCRQEIAVRPLKKSKTAPIPYFLTAFFGFGVDNRLVLARARRPGGFGPAGVGDRTVSVLHEELTDKARFHELAGAFPMRPLVGGRRRGVHVIEVFSRYAARWPARHFRNTSMFPACHGGRLI